MTQYRLTLLAASMALLSTQAQAGPSLGNIKWDGFMNVKGAVTDSNKGYLGHIDNNGDFEETDFGLVATAKISRRLRIASQVHMTTDEVRFDWGYANYSVNENLTVRGGKIKYPGTILSEYVDVGFAYPWVRAPEVIYSETAELSFESYTGAGAVYETGDDTVLTLNLYSGQVSAANAGDEAHDKLIGLVATVSNDFGEIKLNANQSEIDDPTQPEHGEDRSIMSAGIRGEMNNIVLYSEFSHSEIDNFSASDTDAWYATVGYKMGNTMPHLTYQSFEVDNGIEQNSWTLGVKHQLAASTVAKLEVQRISDIKNGGLFSAQPDDDDVTLLSASVNFVF